MAKTDMDATLNYINTTVNDVYNRLYDISKEMDKDELVQLIGSILDQQKKKENELLDHIYDADNIELATNYAYTTQAYIKGLDSSVDNILGMRTQKTEDIVSENALPSNIIK